MIGEMYGSRRSHAHQPSYLSDRIPFKNIATRSAIASSSTIIFERSHSF
ncbi:MAG: hypothetical protein ACHBN1_35450 [Heteroscytonema crispum UTEX LB 1556]